MPIPIIGAAIRSWAKEQAQQDEVIDRALKTASVLTHIQINGEPVYRYVMFAVPRDRDCGTTASKLQLAFNRAGLKAKAVEFSGDPNREVLNDSVQFLHSLGAQYVTIMSNKALEYLTSNLMEKTIDLLQTGARAVGVEIDEYADYQEIQIENTFATWNAASLLWTGGFDSPDGVESVAALARLMHQFGSCAHLFTGNEARLAPGKSEVYQSRYEEVRGSKRKRQEAEAVRVGTTLQRIQARIIVHPLHS